MTVLASNINPEYTKYDEYDLFAYRDAYDERWLAIAKGFPCVGSGNISKLCPS